MTTPNLMLPEVPEAIRNASDEINDGFLTVDALLQLAVVSRVVTVPPTSAVQGQRWIVPSGAVGPWFGRTNHIALRDSTGWRFIVPRNGWLAWSIADSRFYVYRSGAWAEYPEPQNALAVPLKATWVKAPSAAIETPTTDVAIYVPSAAQVTGVSLIGNGGPGSCVVDIWRTPIGGFPADASDSICGGSKPTISGGHTYVDTVLSGWTKTLSAGDTIVFHLESVSTFTALFVALHT